MRLCPGDIVEIETPAGLSFLQVTHRHPSYPEVFRALVGPLAERPLDLEQLARQPSRFVAMFPLSDALSRGELPGHKIGAATIPESAKTFPTFRIEIRDKIDGVRGEVAYRWLWDGDGLTYEVVPQRKTDVFPERKVLSLDELISRIA
jgi:hypothetical protein